MRFGLAALLAASASCASGQTAQPAQPSDAPLGGFDAKVYLDARSNPDAPRPIDAAPHIDAPQPIDAAPMVDAAPPHDACVPLTTELLVNPAFDLSPVGTGWTEQNIDDADPTITGDDGIVEQSAPYKAWMGGLTGQDEGKISVTDQVYQDVMVPTGTTSLVLTGYYAVGTAETGSTVYDTANVDLLQTNGSPIEAILAESNATPTATWTPFSHTFTTNVAGQTVRLRFTSSNDITNETSFYFDTLSLQATHCP
jgi:hypothetical protein